MGNHLSIPKLQRLHRDKTYHKRKWLRIPSAVIFLSFTKITSLNSLLFRWSLSYNNSNCCISIIDIVQHILQRYLWQIWFFLGSNTEAFWLCIVQHPSHYHRMNVWKNEPFNKNHKHTQKKQFGRFLAHHIEHICDYIGLSVCFGNLLTVRVEHFIKITNILSYIPKYYIIFINTFQISTQILSIHSFLVWYVIKASLKVLPHKHNNDAPNRKRKQWLSGHNRIIAAINDQIALIKFFLICFWHASVAVKLHGHWLGAIQSWCKVI